MTKAQANALMAALEGQKVPADAQMRFDSAGLETWQVAIPPSFVMTGPQLGQLSTYCQNNALVLSAAFQSLGIV